MRFRLLRSFGTFLLLAAVWSQSCGASAEGPYQAYIRLRLERIFANKWPDAPAADRNSAALCFSLYAIDGFTESELRQLGGVDDGAPADLQTRASRHLQEGLDQLLTDDWSFLNHYCPKERDRFKYLGS
jgi:hypothetical protein